VFLGVRAHAGVGGRSSVRACAGRLLLHIRTPASHAHMAPRSTATAHHAHTAPRTTHLHGHAEPNGCGADVAEHSAPDGRKHLRGAPHNGGTRDEPLFIIH